MNHQEVEWINMGFQAFGSLKFNQMAWQYVIIVTATFCYISWAYKHEQKNDTTIRSIKIFTQVATL